MHGLYKLLQPLLQVTQQDVDEGARTSVFAVASADGAALKGAYLERSRVMRASASASDTALARRMWDRDEALLAKWLA